MNPYGAVSAPTGRNSSPGAVPGLSHASHSSAGFSGSSGGGASHSSGGGGSSSGGGPAHSSGGGVAAQRVRRAARQAREPAATINVDCRKCPAKKYKDKVRLNTRSGIVAAEGTTELHRAEPELIAKLVGCLSQLLELRAPVGFEQVKLLRTVCQAGERHAEKAN